MIRIISVFLFCVLLLDPALAQTEKYEGYTITFTKAKGSGTAVFENQKFDDVWSALTKTLMGLRYRITESEKVSGTLSAVQKPGGLDKIVSDVGSQEEREQIAADARKWDVLVEALENGGIQVYFVGEDVPRAKKYIQKLCLSIAELLPAKK